uniref:Uncharacterized protein n=1 Tax=uncultured bacterium UPO46 TaxID=1776971 RepID=A0A126SY58_9BACT|nr:conserved hypothetical protein [uncultured bacterium UPO46]
MPASRYRCGLAQDPRRYSRWLPAWLERWLRPAFARWIAAGSGCDADYDVWE